MKLLNAKIIFAIMLVVLLISVFGTTGKYSQAVLSEKVPLDVKMIRSGDLVFRQGRGIFSELFRNIGDVDSQFSHVGVVYKENKGVHVIHTEASELTGIGAAKIEPLSDFISDSNAKKFAFYRVKGLNIEGAGLVLNTALKYVADRIPFDSDFNLSDNDKLYCTELVYKAYKTAGIYLVKKPSIIELPWFSSLKNFEAITIGQLLKSTAVKFIKTQK